MGSRMKEKKDRKKYMLAGAALMVALAAAGLVGVLLRGQSFGNDNPNLALRRGVIATSDSVEQETLSAAMAIDGNDEDLASRWSSENNREDASHYIQLEFPEEISVSFVVLKWERANVISYALEGSADGTAYGTLAAFENAPELLKQEIILEEPVQIRYLRLSTYAVSKESADYSDLYQNVSLYEFEVYADKPAAYKLETPVIEKTAGGRRLVMPVAPEGFRVSFVGADLEQVIGADGTVYDTIQDKDVTVGCRVEDERGREETREVSFVVRVPAADEELDQTKAGSTGRNACPDWVVPSVAEWRGREGYFHLRESPRIIVDVDSRPPGAEDKAPAGTDEATGAEDKVPAGTDEATGAEKKANEQALWDIAALLQEHGVKNGYFQTSMTVCAGVEKDLQQGDIYLGYAQEANGLGKEGYTCDITDRCVIKAEQATGIRWGTVTLMQLMLHGDGGDAPQGQIRDYPLYEVRGFGIDVARKAVSMDTLYRMMETMSWYKMNDLGIHLNDNTILATSGLTGSAEQAMTADSAFRLESALGNEKAETLTSTAYAYTKEEFAAFIATAKTYGVTVVPEIDTPAHSLSITKLYPEYALRAGSDSVDQIDLGNDKAVAFVEEIWREALDEEKGAFRGAEIVNIGMDEYYGDGEQYRQYLIRINNLVQETGRTVRLWGSLSNMGGTTKPLTDHLQMNLWSTVWADPQEMYEAGYSLINMQNNHLYIIPGGGYDRLNVRELYENWAPNRFYDYNRRETIPSWSPQMLGAAYMIWNDMSGSLDVGICEYDLYERFVEPLGVLSVRLWGTAFSGETGQTGDGQAVFGSCLYEETVAAEPDYEIEMEVWLEPESLSGSGAERQAQIIAEGDCAYAEWAFYAVEPETGKVGFTREGRTYTFDYTLPEGEWVSLKLEGASGRTTLYVDGKEVDTLGSSEPFEEHATFVFPLQRVGSRTGRFDGRLELQVVCSANRQAES
ncbi:MAG: family 20 glycosylhydrolase [Lachnospiraceae bacterium]|nr:family 20 glycosylhydrolase [Lachnospiraceae bacterium]